MDCLTYILSDTFFFPLFECILFLVFIYALLKDVLARIKNPRLEMTRGEDTWQYFSLAYGILAVIATQVVSIAESMIGFKTSISFLNLVILLYLTFYNSWFRNKIVGLIMRSKQ